MSKRPTEEQIAAIDSARALIARGQAELVAAAEAAFPIGARVRVEIGGHTIDGTVTGHAANWSDSAGTVYVENGKTGKRRSFAAGFNAVEVL